MPRLILAALFASTLAFPAMAQQGMACAPRATVLDELARAGQTRRAMGQAGPAALMELYASEADHWSLIVTLRDGRSCLLARGHSFAAKAEFFPPSGQAT